MILIFVNYAFVFYYPQKIHSPYTCASQKLIYSTDGPQKMWLKVSAKRKSVRLDETKRNNYLIFAEFNLHRNNELIFDSSHEMKATLDHFWMYLRDICYFAQVTVMDWILTPFINIWRWKGVISLLGGWLHRILILVFFQRSLKSESVESNRIRHVYFNG